MKLSGFALIIFPVIFGGLSGFAGFHFLFKAIQAISIRRGSKVGTIGGASLIGLVAYVWGGYILGFGDFQGLIITGIIPGIFGAVVGSAFSYGVASAKRILVEISGFFVGFFFGALLTIHLLFSFFTASGPQGLLIFGLNYLLGIVGGISGAIVATGVSFFEKYSEPEPLRS